MAENLTKPANMEEGMPSKAITEREERKVSPVVQGSVKRKKQPAGERLRESLGLEKTRTVGDYLVWDVLIPAAKEMVADLVKKGIDVFLYGGASTSDRPQGRPGRTSRVNYGGYYSGPERRGDYRQAARDRRYADNVRFDAREFIFEDYVDDKGRLVRGKEAADIVLSELIELIDVYGQARVSDFYSAVGETERSNFTDKNYGWDALGYSDVVRVRDGWVIDLPRPIPLN